MQYRKYKSAILVGAIIIVAQGLFACASTPGNRQPSSIENNSEDEIQQHRYDGREPASMHGGFTWLDDVGDNFSRIAADTSNRAVASENDKEVLIKQKNWNFSYLPKTNHFYVGLHGETYSMVQTSIGDGKSYAFAAEGQADNPVTLSLIRSEGRQVASGIQCDAQLSYWNAKTHSYTKDVHQVHGEACEHLINKLKDYVP